MRSQVTAATPAATSWPQWPASALPRPRRLSKPAKLIAIGAAIGARREPCLEFHYDKARTLGVSTAALLEAVRVGEMVKNASTKSMLKLAEKLIGRADEGPVAAAAPVARTAKSGYCS